MILSRRTLLTTATSGTLVSVLAPSVRAAFAPSGAAGQRDILVAIILRFGCDGLTMVAPADDGQYRDKRPTIGVRASGANAGLPIGALDGVPFFLNPNAPELKALYDAQKLAVVHAVGLPTDTRSHFESQDMMERGAVAGDPPLTGGWLTRHLASSKIALPELGAVAAASDVHVSLHGLRGAVAVPDVTQFNVTGGDFNLNVIDALNAGDDPAAISARETVAMIRGVQARLARLPADADAIKYPESDFGTALKSLAKVIKMDAGLEVAAVDLSGWDHHYNMNLQFPGHTQQLSKAVSAFWEDLRSFHNRLTIVTMTEFGRRLEENTAGGTDHGAASCMFVLGGAVSGGRIYGKWPGLKPNDLREGDLRVTTDMRQVLQEILVKRRGETDRTRVFPSLSYAPLGLVAAR